MQIRFDIRKFRAAEQIDSIRSAVSDYVQYAPNADLGEASPRENIRSAFFLIRSSIARGDSLYAAAGHLHRIAYSMMDM